MQCKKYKTKNGETRWYCVEDGPPDPFTGKRNQIKRTGKTQKEAKARVNAAIRELEENGIDVKANKNKTFRQVAEAWLDTYARTGVKKNTVRIRKKELAMLYKYMENTTVSNITYSMYQKVINSLMDGGEYERSTVQGANITGSMVFRYAVRDGIIKDNPSTDIVVPKPRLTVEEIENQNIDETFMENHELEEFFQVVDRHGLALDRERFYLLAFSGMRPGELCALKKNDLNFETNTITITKTIYSETNNMREYDLTPPKTEGSIREIQIEKPIMDMLRQLVRRNDKHKLRFRNEYEDFHDEHFVFCRGNGYPYFTKTLESRMARLMSKTTIKKDLSPHSFRHTHISMLTEAGVDLPTIMERVGHRDVATTTKVYTHVTKKMKKRASENVSKTFEGILSKIDI